MIGLRLSNDLLRKVKAAAKEENRKLGPMVGEIVRRYFRTEEQAAESNTMLRTANPSEKQRPVSRVDFQTPPNHQ